MLRLNIPRLPEMVSTRMLPRTKENGPRQALKRVGQSFHDATVTEVSTDDREF
jgi:hypothetical protein